MSRYIDADVLIDDLIHNRSFYPAIVASAIKNTPTADVAEVRHGYWLDENLRPHTSKFICSECGDLAYFVQPPRDKTWKKCCPYKYCPNCGAQMKGE